MSPPATGRFVNENGFGGGMTQDNLMDQVAVRMAVMPHGVERSGVCWQKGLTLGVEMPRIDA